MIDITEKKICLFGTGGTGKTVHAMQLWNRFKLPLAYDINGDFVNCKGGIAYTPQDIDGEFLDFLEFYFKTTNKKHIDAIFFDDSDAYINYEMMNSPRFKDLVIRHRNKYKVSLIFISKRPQNLPTMLVENCHIWHVYLLDGYNAIKRVTDIDQRIGELLTQLKPYEYVTKLEGQTPTINKPV